VFNAAISDVKIKLKYIRVILSPYTKLSFQFLCVCACVRVAFEQLLIFDPKVALVRVIFV
jgi:hypothetical protein